MLPIIVVNADNEITFTNEALCELVDSDTYELRGKQLCNIIDPNTQELRELLNEDVYDPSPFFYTSRVLGPVGEQVPVTFKLYPVLDPAGVLTSRIIVGVSAGLRDAIIKSGKHLPEDRLRSTYAHTSLSYDEGKKLFKQLEALMVRDKLFLQPETDLDYLCRQLKTNQLYLSQTVNFFSDLNFRDYINGHRIKYLETDDGYDRDQTIDSIWRLAGFGSYSAFRRYLQSQYTETPSSFLKRIRTNAEIQVG